MSRKLYSIKEIAEEAVIKERDLGYLIEHGRILPTIAGRKGRGNTHLFSQAQKDRLLEYFWLKKRANKLLETWPC